MSKNKIGIVDVAKYMGLSRSTVSYALNGKHKQVNLSPVTVAKIQGVAAKLGYRPNYWAKALSSKSTKSIGILYPDISGSSAHEFTQGIQEVFESYGVETMMAVSYWQPEKLHNEMELMLEKCVNGIIASPQSGSIKSYELAISNNTPLVFVGDYIESLNVSSVVMDSEDAIHKLLNHLHQLGHIKIGFLSVAYQSTVLTERESAFKSGMNALGLEYKSDYVRHAEITAEISVYENVRNLVLQNDPPSALICVSDYVALQAMAELARLNVKVPNDLAIASIGNIAYSDHPFFSLTTVDESRVELGRRAASLLLNEFENEDSRDSNSNSIQKIRIKGQLLTRASTLGGKTSIPGNSSI